MEKKKLQKKKLQDKESQKKKTKREHRISFMLNDLEYKAIESHLKKYKIKNKSKWYRNVILAYIWKVMEEDYPTLFNENEMR